MRMLRVRACLQASHLRRMLRLVDRVFHLEFQPPQLVARLRQSF